MTPVRQASILAGFALALAANGARAESFNVSISSAAVSLGNFVIVASPAQVRVAAATGAVSVVGGEAVRIKANGAAPTNAAVQTVTVTCVNSAGSCKNTYKIYIAAASVSGQATGVSAINVANLTATAGTVVFGPAPEAPPGQMFTLTSSSAAFTVTFAVGATATLNAGSGGSAAWSYNVRISP